MVAGAAVARSCDFFNSVLRWKTSFACVLERTHDPKPRSPTRKAQNNAKPQYPRASHASRLEHPVANSRPRVGPSSLFPPPPPPFLLRLLLIRSRRCIRLGRAIRAVSCDQQWLGCASLPDRLQASSLARFPLDKQSMEAEL